MEYDEIDNLNGGDTLVMTGALPPATEQLRTAHYAKVYSLDELVFLTPWSSEEKNIKKDYVVVMTKEQLKSMRRDGERWYKVKM